MAENAPEQRKHKERSVLSSVLTSGATVAVSKTDPLAISVYVPSSSRSSSPKPPPSPIRRSPTPTKDGATSSEILRCPSPDAILESKYKQRRVRINVGGDVHEILWDNLGKLPETRLGKLKNATSHEEIIRLCEDYSLDENEYFFDRQPKSFSIILNLYRTSKLHLSEEVCLLEYLDELEYWGIDESLLDSCCQVKLQQRRDQLHDDAKKDSELLFLDTEEEFGDMFMDKIRKSIWDLFEKSVTVPQRVSRLFYYFTHMHNIPLNVVANWQVIFQALCLKVV